MNTKEAVFSGTLLIILMTFFFTIPLFNMELMHGFYLLSIVYFIVLLPGVINHYKDSDLYSVRGVLNVLFIYVFSVSPVIHVMSGFYYWGFPSIIEDWRDLFLKWQIVCLIPVIFYSFIVNRSVYNVKAKSVFFDVDKISISKLNLVFLFFFTGSFLLQLMFYLKFGGVSGYLITREVDGLSEFSGMGIYFVFSESGPIVFAIWYILRGKINNRKGLVFFVTGLVIVLLLKLYFGGLSGSRGNIIWVLFWYVGLYHIFIKKLGLSYMIFGLVFLIVFMAVYGVYKYAKTDFSATLSQSGITQNNYVDASNPFVAILLTDFSRADIQAYSIYSIDKGFYNDFKNGQTYLNSLSKFIPLFDSSTLASKREAGTELIFNVNGSFTTRVHGLFGEFVMNFHYFFFFIPTVIFGFLVFLVTSFFLRRNENDIVKVFIPFSIHMLVLVFIFDSDNFVFYFVKNGLVPFVFCMFIRKFCSINN
jgi:hypothetical protein